MRKKIIKILLKKLIKNVIDLKILMKIKKKLLIMYQMSKCVDILT